MGEIERARGCGGGSLQSPISVGDDVEAEDRSGHQTSLKLSGDN
jgi:hypothetical protein